MKNEQKEQDLEYGFPYHYIPKYNGGFTQNYNWSWGKQYASAMEFILDKVRRDSASIESIVDLGCGDGRLTKELSEMFTGKQVVGIDYSAKAINLAKALNPNVKYENKNIMDDDLEKCDAITLIEVFEHIPIELCDDFVRATSELLNEGGVVYLTVPHENKPVSYKHFQHFNYDSLLNYFKNYFNVEEVEYIQKNDKLLTLLNMVMTNKLWIINSEFLNNLFYKFYKSRYFYSQDYNCGRIYLKLKKRSPL
jgi:trans-aconitate methyltransferase